ncbi:MAG: hypothetical protein KGJ02_05260 [Verrucomicrobiota bacterium]|nr:hypothetical protein [Verrucomicrobiota bacterium]
MVTPASSKPACIICTEPYSPRTHKPVMLIPCGHGVCEACIGVGKVEICPFDKAPFQASIVNYDLLRVIDPGVEISSKTEALLSAVKERSGSPRPTMAVIPDVVKPAPTVAQLPRTAMEEIENLHFAELIDQRTGFPRRAHEHDYPLQAIGAWRAEIIISPESDDRTQALFLLGIFYWALGEIQTAKDCFRPAANSRDSRAFSRFAWAYLTINTQDAHKLSVEDLTRAKRYFELVDYTSLPIHASLSRFYRTCFQLKVWEGVEKDNRAYAELFHLIDDPHLPEEHKAFCSLMVGEAFLFGVGSFGEFPDHAVHHFSRAANNTAGSRRVRAKAYYWLGLIGEKGVKTESIIIPPQPDNAKELFKKASDLIRWVFATKEGLKSEFKKGNYYPDRTGIGPHYEHYLDLYLHSWHDNCVIL